MALEIAPQVLEHALERRIDRVFHRPTEVGGQLGLLDVGSGDERRGLRGLGKQRAKLGYHALDGDLGRSATVAHSVLQVAQVLVDVGVERAVARDQLLDVLGRVGRVPVEQLGQPHLGTLHLVHRHLVETQPQRLQPEVDRQLQHVGGDAILILELGRQQRLQTRAGVSK